MRSWPAWRIEKDGKSWEWVGGKGGDEAALRSASSSTRRRRMFYDSEKQGGKNQSMGEAWLQIVACVLFLSKLNAVEAITCFPWQTE